jgi:hypothetical protein
VANEWIPVIGAAIGASAAAIVGATGIIFTWLTGKQARDQAELTAEKRQEHERTLAREAQEQARLAWRRDARAAVYADALAYIQVGYQLYERMLYPEYGNGRPPELQHQDLITARMRLLAPPKTFDKWIAFRDSYEALAFYANENFSGDPLEVLIKADDPLAVKFSASVEEANAAIRDSLDS